MEEAAQLAEALRRSLEDVTEEAEVGQVQHAKTAIEEQEAAELAEALRRSEVDYRVRAGAAEEEEEAAEQDMNYELEFGSVDDSGSEDTREGRQVAERSLRNLERLRAASGVDPASVAGPSRAGPSGPAGPGEPAYTILKLSVDTLRLMPNLHAL